MKKIIVLGAGMVGSAIAIDLSNNFDVTSVDINQEALENLSKNHNIKIRQFDISQSEKLKDIININVVILAICLHNIVFVKGVFIIVLLNNK